MVDDLPTRRTFFAYTPAGRRRLLYERRVDRYVTRPATLTMPNVKINTRLELDILSAKNARVKKLNAIKGERTLL
jgi:hypothetical protein